MNTVALLLAGGSGSRMAAASGDKLLLPVAGRPAFAHVLTACLRSGIIDGTVIVSRSASQQQTLQQIAQEVCPDLPARFVRGGATRQESVKAGLAAVPDSTRWIMVHDCARPAVHPESMHQLHQHLLRHKDPCSLAHRVPDTIRSFATDPTTSATTATCLNRSTLWAMETPQAFPAALLQKAHAALRQPVTDDLAAVEAMGCPVRLVENPFPNPKLTRPADRPYLESILAMPETTAANPPPYQPPFRVGFGYDVHRFAENRPLVLAGVPFDHPRGLLGHSDADVLCHAAADAVLGAAGLPDIGHFFPNTDSRWKDADSLHLLRLSVQHAADAGYHVLNLDLTVIAEEPKIAPHLDAMKQNLADATNLPVSAIGLKATTHEGIGALGHAHGIAAHAVAALAPQAS